MFDSNFESDDIEFLDTSDDFTDDSDDVEAELSEEIDDAFYHATPLTSDELDLIDELWTESEADTKDTEPYIATKNEDIVTDIISPYKAGQLSESNDVLGELDDSIDIESFAADVESMTFDDLKTEQERLERLSQMKDFDMFNEYDISSKYDSDLLDSLTDGLPKETLEQLKAGLASGDIDTYRYFGLDGNNNDSQDGMVRSRKK